MIDDEKHECKHEHTEKMWFEKCYGLIGIMITQCKYCGKMLDIQWYQSNDCGEHWFEIDSPMEGK